MNSAVELYVDREEPCYRPHEKVVGRICVSGPIPHYCYELQVDLLCCATNGSDRDEQSLATQVIAIASTLPSGQHSFAFELQFPGGPGSLCGVALNIEWKVRAVLIQRWNCGPQAELGVVLMGAPKAADGAGIQATNRWFPLNDERSALPLCFGVMILMIVLFASESAAMRWGGVLAALGLWRVGVAIENAQSWGKAEFKLSATGIRAGEDIECVLNVTPRRDLTIGLVSIELLGRERWFSTDAEQGWPWGERIFFRQVGQVSLSGARLQAGKTSTGSGVVRVPTNMAPSWSADIGTSALRREWCVRITFQPESTQSVVQELPIRAVSVADLELTQLCAQEFDRAGDGTGNP